MTKRVTVLDEDGVLLESVTVSDDEYPELVTILNQFDLED